MLPSHAMPIAKKCRNKVRKLSKRQRKEGNFLNKCCLPYNY